MALSGAFGAKFLEVRVAVELGVFRIARVLSVIDGGRVGNAYARRASIGGSVSEPPLPLHLAVREAAGSWPRKTKFWVL
jgi:hypothetical protein